jgi:hypothetical protein
MRVLKIVMGKNLYYLCLAILAITSVVFVWQGAPIRHQELSRVADPAGQFDAVVARPVGEFLGATLPERVKVFVVPKGASLPEDAAFAVDKPLGVRVDWKGNHNLIIYADRARVFVKKLSVYVSTGLFSRERIEIEYHILDETTP